MLGQELLDRTIALPGYAAYERRAVHIWRAPENSTPMLETSLRDLGRFLCGIWALYLHGTSGGITLSRLSELLDLTGVSGPGRARSVLTFMRFIGYIEPAPAAGDGRVRAFQPTPRMSQAFRERYRREFAAAGPLDPDITEALVRLDDDAFFLAIMAGIGELCLAGFEWFEFDAVSLNVISHKFAGMMVLGELLTAAEREDAPFPPVGPMAYSLAGVAKACGVSRTQVRRVLKEGRDHGFMEMKGDGELVLTPLLAEHVRLLIACAYIMLQWACAKAIATTANQTG